MVWSRSGGGKEAIEPFLRDPSVSEIMVNGPGPVWIERRGRLETTNTILDTETIELLIEQTVAPLGRRIDRSSPMVDARLPDGSRLNAVVPPVAVDGPYVTIRRFSVRPVPLEEFAPPGVVAALRWAVGARCNLVVSGGAGAGKTTLLNALAASIPQGERVVTVEDAAELALGSDHVVRLEARPVDADGVAPVTIRQLVRNALRMRPDRIIVGEVRGAETLDMLQAMNTGHEGSLSTCHANSPADADQPAGDHGAPRWRRCAPGRSARADHRGGGSGGSCRPSPSRPAPYHFAGRNRPLWRRQPAPAVPDRRRVPIAQPARGQGPSA